MNEYLKGKKILFIAPVFNGYENHIFSELEARGANVHFFGEMRRIPYANFLSKFKMSYFFCNFLQKKYLENILNKIDAEYDYLFIIRGEFLTGNFLNKMFEKSKFAYKILYQWDSLQYLPNIKTVAHLFDRKLSYDRKDCDAHGFEYQPTFAIKYFTTTPQDVVKLYDFSFIGSYDSYRYNYISILKNFAIKNGYSCHFKLKMSFFRFVVNKLVDKSFKLDFNEVIFKNISLVEVSKIVQSSNIVLEILKEKQTGMTLRTFEVLGSGVKLLTNNQNIRKEKFYDANNICLFDELNEEFMLSPFHHNNMKEYYIESWVDKIFGSTRLGEVASK